MSTRDPILLITTVVCCRVVPPARRGELAVEDLPLPEKQQADPAYAEFIKNWDAAVAKGKASGKPPTLMRVSISLRMRACRCLETYYV